jgi:hypothetical protein
MKHFLFYDPKTGLGRYTKNCQEIPKEGIFIETPTALKNPSAWKVVDGKVEFVGRNVTPMDVNLERDRRISNGFIFNGEFYNADRDSISRITTTLLTLGSEHVSWINKENAIKVMAPNTFREFATKASQHERKHILEARRLKDQDPIPQSYMEDRHWPAIV